VNVRSFIIHQSDRRGDIQILSPRHREKDSHFGFERKIVHTARELDRLKRSGYDRGLKSECAILDVLFPKVRAQLLRLLFNTPQKERYVRELVMMTGLALSTVQDELRKLKALGLVSSWSNGYHRFFKVNREHPLFTDLFHLIQTSGRLPPVKYPALRHRRHSRIQQNRRRRQKPAVLGANRPTNWGLFSRKGESSTR
jgi:DNA-binding transcriptional ArsR family regulator